MREVADKAVDEFDKVRRLQREAVQRVNDVRARAEERFRLLRRASFTALDDFVQNLAALRQLRGELITLKEVRYVNVAQIEESERAVIAADRGAFEVVREVPAPAHGAGAVSQAGRGESRRRRESHEDRGRQRRSRRRCRTRAANWRC